MASSIPCWFRTISHNWLATIFVHIDTSISITLLFGLSNTKKGDLSNCLKCLEEQKVEFKFCTNEKKLVEIKSLRLEIAKIEKKERMDMYRLWLVFATTLSICLTSVCLYIVFMPGSVLPAKHFASFFAGASCLTAITSGAKFLDTFRLSS
jgi:hypothetical protein